MIYQYQLRAESEEILRDALDAEQRVPAEFCLDWIGTIYAVIGTEPSGEPQLSPVAGCHCNLYSKADTLPESLERYAVYPATPKRVIAL